MITQLAQAIKLPGPSDTPIPIAYPTQFQPFIFQGNQHDTIGYIVSNAFPLILAFAGLGLLLMLISAGYTFLTSAGDAKKMEQGKQQLTNAIVGFFIVFAAYWIVQLTGTIFGLESVTSVFK
ncbi:MAG: hypothetical protein NT149_00455 [Candidatus Gottesmanbacteria bacterium]|nr:hypothetical protein [Candidatus Gottesmanbacteria bacterium]